MSVITTTPDATEPKQILALGLATHLDTLSKSDITSSQTVAELESQTTLVQTLGYNLNPSGIDRTTDEALAQNLAELRDLLRSKNHWHEISIGYGIRRTTESTGVFGRVMHLCLEKVEEQEDTVKTIFVAGLEDLKDGVISVFDWGGFMIIQGRARGAGGGSWVKRPS